MAISLVLNVLSIISIFFSGVIFSSEKENMSRWIVEVKTFAEEGFDVFKGPMPIGQNHLVPTGFCKKNQSVIVSKNCAIPLTLQLKQELLSVENPILLIKDRYETNDQGYYFQATNMLELKEQLKAYFGNDIGISSFNKKKSTISQPMQEQQSASQEKKSLNFLLQDEKSLDIQYVVFLIAEDNKFKLCFNDGPGSIIKIGLGPNSLQKLKEITGNQLGKVLVVTAPHKESCITGQLEINNSVLKDLGLLIEDQQSEQQPEESKQLSLFFELRDKKSSIVENVKDFVLAENTVRLIKEDNKFKLWYKDNDKEFKVNLGSKNLQNLKNKMKDLDKNENAKKDLWISFLHQNDKYEAQLRLDQAALDSLGLSLMYLFNSVKNIIDKEVSLKKEPFWTKKMIFGTSLMSVLAIIAVALYRYDFSLTNIF